MHLNPAILHKYVSQNCAEAARCLLNIFIQLYYHEGDEGKESSDLSDKVIGCVLKVHEISSSPSYSVMVK